MGFLNILKYIPVIGEPAMAKANTDMTIEANKKMAEYSYNKDLQMWNLANQYNSPTAQMERFKKAGLNPNLIYGQGSAGNATQLPKYQAPKSEYNYQTLKALPVLGAYQSLQRNKAQIDLIKEQADYTRSKNINEGLQTALKNILLNKENLSLQYLPDWLRQRNTNQMFQGQLMQGQGVLQKYSSDYKKKQIDAFDRITNMQLSSLAGQLAKTKVDTSIATKNLEMYNLGMFSKIAPGISNLLKMFLLGK